MGVVIPFRRMPDEQQPTAARWLGDEKGVLATIKA